MLNNIFPRWVWIFLSFLNLILLALGLYLSDRAMIVISIVSGISCMISYELHNGKNKER
jgi:hypothetical protein